MSPAPDVFGIAELAARWDVSRQRADQVTRQPGFPGGTQLAATRVYTIGDIEAWEAAELAAGRPLPGGSRRGPRPGEGGRPRGQRQPIHDDDSAERP